MNYESFIREFFGYLKSNNKKCLKLIEKNNIFIENCFNQNSNQGIIKEFVNEINNTILQNNTGKFKLYESVLKSDSFKYIYFLFKNSNILIEACKNGQVDTAKWLITMDINPYIQDKTGRSALMYAVQNEKLLSIVEKYGNDFKCVMLEDHEGNNALYYAIYNSQALALLKEVDINHLNHNHETVLMYSCKKEAYYVIKSLLDRKGINIDIPDKDGKTVPMILMENLRLNEFQYLNQNDCDLNVLTEKGEGVLSALIKQINRKDRSPADYSNYAKIIIYLIKAGIDFNVVVDEDGNTALMAFLIFRDYETFNFLCRFARNLDFKKKNRYGENATSLFLKLNSLPYQVNPMHFQRSFDFSYIDPNNNNTALILVAINKPLFVEDALQYHYRSINDVNIHKESALIIAAKMNNYSVVEQLLKKYANTNLIDDKGNTALHYAVGAKNIPMIYDLIQHGADPHLKNYGNESALEMAKCSGNKLVIDAILGNLSDSEYSKEKKFQKGNNCLNKCVENSVINEYLYTNTSNLYLRLNDDAEKEIKAVYANHIELVNRNRQYIPPRLKYFAQDMFIFEVVRGGSAFLSK
eukprot:jgi/Orpsp1_1/1186905/evm.model.d7180000054027.1